MPQSFLESPSLAHRDSFSRADVRRAIAVSVFLVVAVLIVFGRTFAYGFCGLHDYLYILDEPHVSGGLTWSGIAWAFTDGPLGEWYPLSMLSAMLDCQLYGLNPTGHHVTSVLLHAAAAVTLFWVLWRMTGGLWPSALVAALFALHPLHVEPVAWVSQRRDILSGLFFMFTLGAYGEYVRHPGSVGRYLAVAGFFALGLMAKPILVTVPAVLLLLDFWPLGRLGGQQASAAGRKARTAAFPWRVVLDKLPLLALAVADAGMTMRTHGLRPDSLSFHERLANATISYVVYIEQLFVPVGLSIFNPHPEAGRPAWQVAVALSLLIAMTTTAVVWRRALPYLFVGWFWYLGMLVPVLGLVYVGTEARDDRYTYLSQIGLYIALVWGAMQLGAFFSLPARRWVFGTAAAVMLAGLMACSWRQAGFWRDDETLWERSLACHPNNSTAEYFLGKALEGKDDGEAIAHYRQAVTISANERMIYVWPRAKAYTGLADIAARKGDTPDAIAQYEKALELDPELVLARMNLGGLLAKDGRLDDAITQFQKTIDLSSDGAPAARCNLALAQAEQGNTDEAIANFRLALEGDKNLGFGHVKLAMLLVDRGQVEEAITHLRQAIEIDPDAVGLYFQVAQLLRDQGNTTEAAAVKKQGMKASRRVAEAENRRGTELANQGKLNEAIAQFRSAINAAPDYAEAYCNLGEVLAEQGYLDEASAHYRQALAIDPNLVQARRRLEQISSP